MDTTTAATPGAEKQAQGVGEGGVRGVITTVLRIWAVTDNNSYKTNTPSFNLTHPSEN